MLLLETVYIKGVQNPIDYIYGILGILREDIRTAVTVDYRGEKDFWRPYIQLAKKFLETRDSLPLLSIASFKERPAGLPSWCPNLNSVPEVWEIVPHPGLSSRIR